MNAVNKDGSVKIPKTWGLEQCMFMESQPVQNWFVHGSFLHTIQSVIIHKSTRLRVTTEGTIICRSPEILHVHANVHVY